VAVDVDRAQFTTAQGAKWIVHRSPSGKKHCEYNVVADFEASSTNVNLTNPAFTMV